MLSQNDKEYVIEVLVKQLAIKENPRSTLANPFLGTLMPEQLCQGNPRELANSAVQLCIADGWRSDPPWMVRLFDIFQLRTLDGKIVEIWERSKVPPPHAVDPLTLAVLNNSTVFVNRLQFRQTLRWFAMSQSDTRPILIISGGTKLGKSYSTQYIDHFANIHADITAHRIEFQPELGAEMGPEQIARDLVTFLGRPLGGQPPKETNMKLYTRQLAIWVLGHALATGSLNWLVLDNFQGKNLRADTRYFIEALADVITTGYFSKRCRLILIDFDASTLTVDSGRIEEDYVEACEKKDVEQAVLEILGRTKREVDLAAVMNLIWLDLPSGPERMLEINLRLKALLVIIDKLEYLFSSRPDVDFFQLIRVLFNGLPQGREKLAEIKVRLMSLKQSAATLV